MCVNVIRRGRLSAMQNHLSVGPSVYLDPLQPAQSLWYDGSHSDCKVDIQSAVYFTLSC